MGLFCHITNITRDATDAVDKAHDSKGGRMTVLATVAVAVISIVGNHWQAVDQRKLEEQRWQRQQYFLQHQFGSNYVTAVQSTKGATQ